ncbi:hypothetical protein Acr_00g0044230 [Actinidia rufa]|uniref:Reverse transcriptase domain-containing protein n=1 Tax=Actinidia rufa TaxID=165716 RepID=A0A7J0DKL9_9ERIC|nr:hypothetical protein Acr_00g0044230 [Actinidia rufa]
MDESLKWLKVLKGPLKALNKIHFSHISARAAAAEEDLLQVQQQLHDNPTDSSLQIRVASLKVQSFRLAEADRSFCSQLTKAKYLKNCDKGTKFFHELIKNNRAKSQIVALTKEDGTSTTSIQQVNSLFVQFYKNLLGVSSVCPRLDRDVLVEGKIVEEEHALSLIQPVLDKEIKSALFSIGDDKAPGKILKQLNHAVIALVPKTASASRVEEFRPIACCNVIYKVISKILAARLSPILESLIDPGQSAFVPNRSMVENIYMVQELLRKYCWNRISPRCIMKVDLQKAYDTINWNFLEDVLSGLRISDTKSNIFMAGISRDIMEEIKTITGFSSGRFPFRYLVESLNHLFFQCQVANQVWAEIKSWLRFSRALTTLKATSKWIIKEARGMGVQVVAKKVGFACTVYYIWATRNARIFEGKIAHSTGIIRDIKIQVYRVLHASFPNL